MSITDQPDFPRFNTASTLLRDAEERLLQAVKSGDKAQIAEAKLRLRAALDEYSTIAGTICDNDYA